MIMSLYCCLFLHYGQSCSYLLRSARAVGSRWKRCPHVAHLTRAHLTAAVRCDANVR